MDIIFEFIAQIIFEGAIETSNYKRTPLWLRWILMILSSGLMFFVGGVLIFGAIFAGQNVQIIARISFGVVGVLIIGFAVYLIVKFLKSLKNENHRKNTKK